MRRERRSRVWIRDCVVRRINSLADSVSRKRKKRGQMRPIAGRLKAGAKIYRGREIFT
jgi:hypothetical protein